MGRAWVSAPLPVMFPVAFDPDDPEDAVQDFVAEYKVAFEEIPNYSTSIGYEAAMQVMDCLYDPRVVSRFELQRALKKTDFDRGVTLMEISFTKDVNLT